MIGPTSIEDWILLASNIVSSILLLCGLYLGYRISRKARGSKPPLIPGREKDDLDIRRRRAAKRWNERLKILTSFLNTIGAASFLAIVVVPLVQLGVPKVSVIQTMIGMGIAIGMHVVGQTILFAWKTEE